MRIRSRNFDGGEGRGEFARNHGTEELATLGVEVSGVPARDAGIGWIVVNGVGLVFSHGIEGCVGLGLQKLESYQSGASLFVPIGMNRNENANRSVS